jgi:hypothetical protein
MKMTDTLLAAAVTGILLGVTGCGGAPAPEAETGTSEAAMTGAKHDCKGMNACKGQGGCKVEGKNACKGQNECKGQGGCKTT